MKKDGFRTLNKIVVAFLLSFSVVGYGQDDSPRSTDSSESSPDSAFFEETSSEDSIPHFLETEDSSDDSTDHFFSAVMNRASFSPASVEVAIDGHLHSGYKVSFEEGDDNQYKLVVILTSHHHGGGHRGRDITHRLRFVPAMGQLSRQGDTMYLGQVPVATYGGWWSGWSLVPDAQLSVAIERRPGSFHLYRVTPRLNF